MEPSREDKGEMNAECISTGLGASEEEIFSSDDKGFDVALGSVVVDVETTVFSEGKEALPMIEGVGDGLSDRGVGERFFFAL